VDIEQALETQRHRLLRIVAGMAVLVGVLALGPVSRRLSEWSLGFVGSVLCRAEAAAKYLVIAQARLIVSREGLKIDDGQILSRLAQICVADDTNLSLSECQRCLKRLRAILTDLSSHAARLLHRIEKLMRRTLGTLRFSCFAGPRVSAPLDEWRLAKVRIERPPDKGALAPLIVSPPPELRAGGVGG